MIVKKENELKDQEPLFKVFGRFESFYNFKKHPFIIFGEMKRLKSGMPE